MYYTPLLAEKQIKAHKIGFRTHFDTCAPHARCKQIHKCKICHAIWQKKNLTKYTSHLTDKKLKKFKHALYITVTPADLFHDYELANINIDDYANALTSSAGRRSKSHPFHKGEFLLFKEVTRSKSNGAVLPHLHIILLTDSLPTFSHSLYSFHIQNIEIDLNSKYHNDYKNPLTQTIKKIFMYSTKSDDSRLQLERSTNLSKGKSDLRASSFFKVKPKKSHNLIPIHILMKKINSNALKAKRKSLKSHEDYKRNHPKAKGITVHRHALKIQKQLKAIEQNKQALKTRLKAKLKRAKPRPNVPSTRTHTQKQT